MDTRGRQTPKSSRTEYRECAGNGGDDPMRERPGWGAWTEAQLPRVARDPPNVLGNPR